MANRKRSDDDTRERVLTRVYATRVKSRSVALARPRVPCLLPPPSSSVARSPPRFQHPSHPPVSILPATPAYPSHSRRVFFAPDAFDAFYLSSTRFTCSRRVSSATDASNPPSTRLSGPRRVLLILAASSLAYPGHDLSMACQRASRTGTTSPSRCAHRTRDGPQCYISALFWRVPGRYVFPLNYARPWSSSISMLYHARISEVG